MSYSFRDVWFLVVKVNAPFTPIRIYLKGGILWWIGLPWSPVVSVYLFSSSKKKLFKKSYQIWDAVKRHFPRTSWRRIKIKIFESKNDDVTLFDRTPGRMFSFHCHIAIFSLKRIFFFNSSCKVLKFDISAYKLISGSSFITGLSRKSRRVRTDNRKENIVQRN